MRTADKELVWFTPLPPARNGIADYAAMLVHEVAKLVPCHCYAEEVSGEVLASVEVRDPLQAYRYLGPRSQILHQIGNNRGHVFVLDALRRFGGVSTLHDLSLLYLHELAFPRLADIYGRMQSPAAKLGDTFARHWKDESLKTAANYILFDMTGEVISRSRQVIVHSEYARRKLQATYGVAAEGKITVIPHFAKSLTVTAEEARARLGIGHNEVLLLTSGFATRAKRFDWLIEALHRLQRDGRKFRWIHAGEERPNEYSIADGIRERPGLGSCSSVTGYLTEDDLDRYIAAADVLINLRFPSVGESSGTLARAFSAGRCCIVNDTAAYAEIPRDVVVHVPVFGTAAALQRALDRLIADRSLRETFGDRARRYARGHLSIESIARKYLEVVAASAPEAVRPVAPAAQPRVMSFDIGEELPDLSDALRPSAGAFELTLWFNSAEHLAETTVREPSLAQSMMGPHVDIESVRFLSGVRLGGEADDRVGIHFAGRAGG